MNTTITALRPLRVIVLTGRFGMGHCAAAEAVRQEILAGDPQAQVRVVDVIDELFPNASRQIYRGFGFLVRRCSWVYNLLNRTAGAKTSMPLQRTVLKRLDDLLRDVDLIVATMPVCSQYIAAYKRQRDCHIPLYTYITDVSVHDEWIAPGTDRYFVACEETRQTLLSKGVEDAHIVVSGIPVRQGFRQAAQVRPVGRRVLLMGGGLGLIPQGILDALCSRDDIHVTVITGRNESLLAALRRRYPSVESIGFTDRVDEYLRRADLVVSKSGGLTTFEAIHTRTPLFVLRPFLTQEVGNARYIENHGLGYVDWQKDESVTAEALLALLDNPDALAAMGRNMARLRESWRSSSPLAYFDPMVQPA